MKKLLLSVLLSIGLFANSYNMSILESDENAIKSVSYSDKDKIIFMDYIFKNSIPFDFYTANKVKYKLIDFVCYNSDLRKYIDKGYKLIVTYIYKNNIDLHYIITDCK